jgi:hypothetical protein
MQRYLVFAGAHYYPAGGWRDIRGQADTLAGAEILAAEYNCDLGAKYKWYQIVDTLEETIVKEG